MNKVENPPSARSELGLSELLAVVRRLGQSRALVEESLIRRSVFTGTTKRWYEPLFDQEGVDAWLLGWPCGGDIDLHDHGGASGAIYVLQGSLVETSGTPRARRLRQRTVQAGQSIAFGPDHVHDIVNRGAVPAVSLHVYGPRLEAMTYYRIDERSRRLIPDRVEPVESVA
ncbi:MAG TPA: cysteine dioxygenase family protein [Acidimicrobiales bacterium]|nr:cysteine dioxygenase family protein [Acidimicrobiales bacterium]